MVGERGPVRKRSDQRVRRNKDEVPTEKVVAIGTVQVPELGFDDPHPIVRDLYESLASSAQSRYYEPSDWQYARLALHFADQLLKSSKPNGQLLTTVNQMLTGLLVSEGDRRRVQLEVERTQAEGVVVDVAAMFREQLGAAQRTG
ncbi:terminase small subunit [Mycobacterium phage Chupacabra]|uniref:Terminase small subunit n=1 Tax=Mycobacterium phage Chupacabra TaxID=2686096 RepID=A0A6B9LHJ3_9CAUD|nr:terminase small subunit [Mycobacterium phage Chupacabra]